MSYFRTVCLVEHLRYTVEGLTRDEFIRFITRLGDSPVQDDLHAAVREFLLEEYIRVEKWLMTSSQLDGKEKELFEAFRGRPKAFLDTQARLMQDGAVIIHSAGMVFSAIACDVTGDDSKAWYNFFFSCMKNYSPTRYLFKTEEELIDYLKNMQFGENISDLMSSKLNLSRKLCSDFLSNNDSFLDMNDKSEWDKCLTYIEAGEFKKIVTTRGFLQEIKGLNISAKHIQKNRRLDLLSKIVEMGNNLDFSRVPEREFTFEDLITMGITHDQIKLYFHENIFEGMSSREFNRFIQSLSGRTLDCMARRSLETILILLRKFIEKEMVEEEGKHEN